MKKMNFYNFFILLMIGVGMSGCYKLQKDFQYKPSVIDPHYNMTTKEFLLSKGTAGVGGDTIFKWMQFGIEYAGIDMAEYEKPGRTFILLHTNAIRTLTSGKVTGGFFFDYPIVVEDASGNIIKSKIDATLDSTRPAVAWNEYSQQFVKNYFLYLILQGEYGFDNLTVNNTSVQTLLPPGTKASPNDSRLAWVITKTTPNPDPAAASSITLVPNSDNGGFDPEGKMNLKLINDQNSPLNINDRSNNRTAGFYFTNGQAHVYDRTIHPFRYSYP